MTRRLSLDWTKAHDVLPLEKQLSDLAPELVNAKKALVSGKGKGSEFTGWVNFLEDFGQSLQSDIRKTVEKICQHSNAVVVVGIGGSLLGTKAVYEALSHSYAALNPADFHTKPLLFWAGHHLATDDMVELLDALNLYAPSLVVVSKSGTTTEPALAFRVLKKYLDDRFGASEAAARIFAITDPESGTLLKLSKQNHYPHFPIPRNIGGRYSVFTAVGLLPLAVAGVDIKALCQGALDAGQDCKDEKNNSVETNLALCYAGVRNILYREGYKVEALCGWTPKLRMIAEWWKQLFGESDAKDNTGLFPASVNFTTDLHSMGQYFQEGERHMFATHIRLQDEYSAGRAGVKRSVKIPDAGLDDGFDFLNGTEISKVQWEAEQGTFLAHADGKVPTLVWELPELNAYWLGYWMYTNMFACAISGYARGVNPFDQPGVEAYKNNMFALIGKPSHQQQAAEIRTRLERGQRLRSLGPTSKP